MNRTYVDRRLRKDEIAPIAPDTPYINACKDGSKRLLMAMLRYYENRTQRLEAGQSLRQTHS